MGYYSDVGIVMQKEDYEQMFTCAAIEHIDLGEWPGLKLGEKDERVKEFTALGKQWVAIHFENVKWYYGDFPEITFMQDYVYKLQHYQFARMGESDNDYEEDQDGDAPYVFNYCRSLEVDTCNWR